MNYVADEYDICVVGAGHAGCEAALAAARLGFKTAIFSINLDSIANMPCNPNIGGTAKGQLVREIDALGGEMGKTADKNTIQSRILNASKGPAVYSLRAQIDRRKYQATMKHTLELQENLYVKQAEIVEVLYEDAGTCHTELPNCHSEPKAKNLYNKQIRTITGVITHTGTIYKCKIVILTTGTYLKGKIIIGENTFSSGPDGIFPADKLSDCLSKMNIKLIRLKTGTPARINRRSVDFSKMQIQSGDESILPFSFENEPLEIEQVSCWLTRTSQETHEIIKKNIHRSPLYGGIIQGVGPRYCPSIEDKIVRFSDKESHQIFIEPMGTDTEEMYVQGFSTSMPEDVQEQMLKSVPGLENVNVMRNAYAIEYDAIDATQLKLSLEFKDIDGLFAAGQINGSSGYEEAAGQGIIAGINAAMKLKGKEPLILDRSQAYIGVLIDDLVTKGTKEPYRMMTSSAEYRLLLRQDNADLRLTAIGYEIGLISKKRFDILLSKKNQIENEIERVLNKTIPPGEEVNAILSKSESTNIKTGVKLAELIRRPELSYDALKNIDTQRPELPETVRQQVNITIKYEGYIKRQEAQVSQFKRMENKTIPSNIDYNKMKGLSLEAIQKLNAVKPASIGQASRITGVSPADISVLLIYMAQKNV